MMLEMMLQQANAILALIIISSSEILASIISGNLINEAYSSLCPVFAVLKIKKEAIFQLTIHKGLRSKGYQKTVPRYKN